MAGKRLFRSWLGHANRLASAAGRTCAFGLLKPRVHVRAHDVHAFLLAHVPRVQAEIIQRGVLPLAAGEIFEIIRAALVDLLNLLLGFFQIQPVGLHYATNAVHHRRGDEHVEHVVPPAQDEVRAAADDHAVAR